MHPLEGQVSQPKLVFSVDPDYTDEALKKRVQGVTVVSLIVDAEGSPRDVKISRSLAETVDPEYRSAARSLDEKAVESVKQYRYRPGRFKGKPVAVSITQEVTSGCSEPPLPLAAEAFTGGAVPGVGAASEGGSVGARGKAGGGGCLLAALPACVGFAVEGLRLGGGAAGVAQGEDFDLKRAAFSLDLEHVAHTHGAGRLGALAIGLNAAELAGAGGKVARFEEAGGPKPFVDTDGCGGLGGLGLHSSIFARNASAACGRCSRRR